MTDYSDGNPFLLAAILLSVAPGVDADQTIIGVVAIVGATFYLLAVLDDVADWINAFQKVKRSQKGGNAEVRR